MEIGVRNEFDRRGSSYYTGVAVTAISGARADVWVREGMRDSLAVC